MKAVLLGVILFFTFGAFSQWNSNSAINTPVCIASKSQNNAHSVSDTKRGIIIAWDDNRNSITNSTDIYAQRMKSNGFEKWATNGIAICTNTLIQKSVAITGAGIDGSAIITWEDNRNGNWDIYAQKIDSSGNVLWTTDGVVVCNKTTSQKAPKIVSDNSGGAIIVWEDSVNFYWDITAQRISSTGTPVWTINGLAVCAAPNTQNNPRIDVDNLGGAIFTWQDKRNNIDYDIYAQRFNSNGTALWTTNGVVVCNAVNVQNNPRIEPDGANGALISWVDKRNAIDYDLFAQRITAAGNAQWAANGIAVCTATSNQTAQDMKCLGTNLVIITWKDFRNSKFEIYAQQLDLSGTAQLVSNGILLSSSSSIKSINPNSITDGQGGSIIAWQDSTALGFDIYSQRLNSTGTLQWTIGGVAISNATDDQVNITQVSDANGGAIYAWEDRRNGSDYEIYAHHIYGLGNTNSIHQLEGNGLSATCFPNPINNNSTIELKNNNLPWNITIFDIYGNEIDTKTILGNEKFKLEMNDFSAGLYFYSIQLSDKSASTKGSFISIK